MILKMKRFKSLSVLMSIFMFVSILSNMNIKALADTVQSGNLVTNGTFDSGNINGWSQDGCTAVASQEQAASGTYSMKVTDRKNGWDGPSFDLKSIMQVGHTYNISAKVRAVSGQAATHTEKATISMFIKPVDGTASYPAIGNYEKSISETEWTILSGSYKLTETGTLDTLKMYIHSDSDNTLQFYVDDVIVTDAAAAATGNVITNSTFENASASGWSGFCGATINSVNDTPAHGGSYSLKVAGRGNTAAAGPLYDLSQSIVVGKTYNVDFWVKNNGDSSTQYKATVKATTASGTTNYIQVNNAVAVSQGVWTEITGSFTVPASDSAGSNITYSNINIYVETPGATSYGDFYIDDFTVTGEIPKISYNVQTDIPSLKDVFKDYFTLGGEVEPPLIESGSQSEQLVSKHYGMLVAGNQMKPDSIEHVKGTFTYAAADGIVNYAIAHNLPMRGHTFVWHSQVPDWMFQTVDSATNQTRQATHDELIANETDYITKVLTHFTETYGTADGKNTPGNLNPTGKISPIKCWDAVNEVISDDSNIFRLDSTHPWYEIAGEDYIKTAFNVAHSIDPSIKLFINDYGTENNGAKTDKLYNLVKKLKGEGVPIDGIGMQMHITTNTDINAVKASIEKFASLGVEVQITELDMAVANKPINEAGYEKQARVYKQLFDVLKLEAQKKNIKTVMFWGVSDADSWIPDGDPLLFDRNFQAKDAYYAIADSSKAVVDRQSTKIQQGSAASADDAVWKTVSSINTGVYVKGVSGATATVKALWDTQNLYLKINVNDTTVGNNDSVDIYLDKKDDKATTYQTDDQHITVKRSDCVSDSNGYTVYKTIPISDVKPAVGNTLGFDVRVNDDQGNGTIDSQTVWNDYGNRQDTNTAYFGDLVLSDAASLATAVYATPTVDGTIDDVWSKAKTVNTNTWVQGTSGATAKVKTLWDSNNLYVLAEVSDSLLNKASANAWEQDSVEIFLDQNNHKTSAYENDDYQIRVNYDNEVSSGSTGLPSGFKSATSKTSTGYIVEEVIPLSAVTPEDGSVLGFDVQVNNADDSGKRVSVATWCDPTGNSWASTANYGYLVLSLVSADVKGGIYNTTKTVNLISSSDANIYYTLDGTDPTTSSTKYTTPITINKDTVLKYFAVTKDGKVSAISTEKYIIDTVAPVITISGVDDNGIYKTSVTPVITIDDNTAAVTKLLNGKSYDGSEIKDNGNYVLKITAVDKAGNSSERTISFVIDTVAPVITISGVNDNGMYKTSVTPVITVDDNTATITKLLNDKSYDGSEIKENGNYVLKVTAVDKAGNSSERTISFVIDTVAPVISISGLNDNGMYKTSVTPVITVDDNTAAVTKLLNDKSYNGSEIKDNGNYVLKVTAVDKAGNSSERTISFVIDTVAPVITITGVNDTVAYKTSVTPVITVDDNTATVTKLLNDKSYDGSEIKDNGQYVLKVTAVDKAGNSTVKTVSFTINKDLVSSNATDILSSISAEQSGANIAVAIDSNNPKADESIFAQLKGQDKSVTFVGSGVTWTFNGKDIVNDLKSLDLSVNIADANDTTSANKAAILAKVKDANAKVISFAPNGILPGPATVKINLGSNWAGKNVFFYYYNPATDKNELVADSVKVDENGILTVTITHNSDFIVTTTKLADASTTTTTSGTSSTSSTGSTSGTTTSTSLPKTGSPVDFNVLVLVGVIFLGTGIYAIRRKKIM